MLLDIAHDRLGWPARGEIFTPSGEGARVYAGLAKAKLGNTLSRQPDATGIQVGILSPDSSTEGTESPLAVVCEFQRQVSDQTLRDAKRLAWSFSRSPMLVTVEPHLLRAWTCCEASFDDLFSGSAVHELHADTLASAGQKSVSSAAAIALHWVNLISGQFFRENEGRFRRDQRADQTLLDNLWFVRDRLRDTGLVNDDICHDLLARVIFIQFLFDRKDSAGKAALNSERLEWLKDRGVLNAKHESFSSILADYEETYRFFRWLDERFNGDLFPGKGKTEREREQAWQEEKHHVKPKHLAVLEQLVSGQLDMPQGQPCLWRQYAFDAIPLEFISSIYEAFVSKRARAGGIYYTPPHLVDFMLDRVLPWSGTEWDWKILDPACGSGVFLVKAFQRLIHRWKNAHPGEDVRADILRRLLERNLFGVDKDPHAVRVASFSLYLAMCDEIDPRHYWTQVRFPLMRGERLINADFFEETRNGFRTREDAKSYDLILGNAPWGEELLTKHAKVWADDPAHRWPVANKGIGTLFLPKSAVLAKPGGRVTMVQSASSLLFNRSGPARDFRKQFFTTFHVEEVVNLSALRFKVFNRTKKASTRKTVAPACVICFRPGRPPDEPFPYLSPKKADDSIDEFQILVEPQDVKTIHPQDGADDQDIWTALMWGDKRDWAFIRRLRNLGNIEKNVGPDNFRRGIEFGDQKKLLRQLKRRRILLDSDFPQGDPLHLRASDLPIFGDRRIHSKDSTDFTAFSLPQLIVKRSWRKRGSRFQARLVDSDDNKGILCTQSYVTVHLSEDQTGFLDAACLSYNSIFAVYFLLLTSSRFASYRPEPLVEEMLRVPIPDPKPDILSGVRKGGSVLDARVRDAFGFNEAEWVLVEDLFTVTLADFKGDAASRGRRRTQRISGSVEEPELSQYSEQFVRVLKATFGQDKRVSATVFQEKTAPWLPFRLAAFHFNGTPATIHSEPLIEKLESQALLDELEQVNQKWLQKREAKTGSVYHQRVARIYDYRGNLPTIYIIKPDACRYWTRSMGLHDADEVAADFMRWQMASVETTMR